jgi:predicted RNA-binding Zn-ribbon protein involved in translation (DUF1610 family)
MVGRLSPMEWVALTALLVLVVFGRQLPWLAAQRRCPECGRWLWLVDCRRGWTYVGGVEEFREGLLFFYACPGCGERFIRNRLGLQRSAPEV